jgi:hypothetical protein
MRCPDCGEEIPDKAWFCGECGKSLGDMSAMTRGTMSRGSNDGSLSTDPYDSHATLGGSPLTLAWASLIVALILLSASVALRFYFFEGLVFNDGDYFSYMQINAWMTYTSGFGDLAAMLGMIFVVVALMRYQSRTNLLARIPRARLATTKLILVISAIVLAAGAISAVCILEFNWWGSGDIIGRLNYYYYGIAWLIATAGLLVFVLGLREAERPA